MSRFDRDTLLEMYNTESLTSVAWVSGNVYETGDVVTVAGDADAGAMYRAYNVHAASDGNKPTTGSNWVDHWAPYNPLLKPVFVTGSEPSLIYLNGANWAYRNLTQAFFYRKPGGDYDRSNIYTSVFNRLFYNNGTYKLKDNYRPQLSRLMMVDIEDGPAGTNTLKYPLTNRNWQKQYDQMARIGNRLEAGGFPRVFYQNWLDDASQDNALWQRMWFQHNFAEALEDLLDRNAIEEQGYESARRWSEHVDMVVYRGYQYYEFIEPDNLGYDQAMYHLDMNIRKQRALFPDKYRVIALQPNFTENGNPIRVDSWNEIVTWCLNHNDVDAVLIFWLEGRTQNAGWQEMWAPDYAKVVDHAPVAAPLDIGVVEQNSKTSPSSTTVKDYYVAVSGGPSLAEQTATIKFVMDDENEDEEYTVVLPADTTAADAAAAINEAITNTNVTKSTSGAVVAISPVVSYRSFGTVEVSIT